MELSLEFVCAFCEGDRERIGELLAEDFRFEGPLLRTEGRAAYLASLAADPPEAGGRFTLLRAFEEDQECCLVYDYFNSGTSLRIAQLTSCQDGAIVSMALIFDTGRG